MARAVGAMSRSDEMVFRMRCFVVCSMVTILLVVRHRESLLAADDSDSKVRG